MSTEPTTIRLAEGAHVDVDVDGLTVRVEHATDADGGRYVQLSGVACDLEGELPGLYYPIPRGEGEWPGALAAEGGGR
jgi:hypothetical protein